LSVAVSTGSEGDEEDREDACKVEEERRRRRKSRRRRVVSRGRGSWGGDRCPCPAGHVGSSAAACV